MKVYTLLPSLEDVTGHIFEYHKAFSKAIQLNGGKYFALIPKKCFISSLPKSWIKALYLDSWKKSNAWKKLIGLLFNFFPLYSLVKKRGKNRCHTIFLEHRTYYLIPVLLCCLLQKIRCQVWIFHRYSFGSFHPKTVLFRFMHFLLYKKLEKSQIRFFTDSELLCKALNKTFDIYSTVLPIPHTSVFSSKKRKKNKDFFAWWPGGSTREEKGLLYISRLFEQLKNSKEKIKLVIAESAKHVFSEHEKIVYVSEKLSREDYWDWMHFSDVILLPYLPSVYAYRTSGIFVEALICGKIVIALDGSWMAYELKRFGLHELAIKKENFNLSLNIPEISKNLEIREKIHFMKEKYKQFHCVENLAKILRI